MRFITRLNLALAGLGLACLIQPASAQSAKNAVQIANLTGLPGISVSKAAPATSYDGVWTNILTASIHTSQQKDLMVGVSAECALFTDTKVSSSLLDKSGATAEAAIEVQVLFDGLTLDNQPFSGPNTPVIFNRRAQTLLAQLAGLVVVNPDGTITVLPETIELILDTTEANSFNWAIANCGAGDHTVTVQARLSIKTDAFNGGTAAAAGGIGWGSLTVEEVRLVKDATPLTP